MQLTLRREPFAVVFDELFSDFFNRASWSALPVRSAELPAAVRARLDVVDKGDKFAVTVDLPGVRKEDIRVSVDGARVSIRAEAKEEKETKDGDRVLHTERYASRYERSFELPVEVTDDNADARFENGVLALLLPKRAATASRQLTIK